MWRKSGLTGRTAATQQHDERQVWAVRVDRHGWAESVNPLHVRTSRTAVRTAVIQSADNTSSSLQYRKSAPEPIVTTFRAAGLRVAARISFNRWLRKAFSF